ncbi:MAG: hypothetical protein U0354_07475 [Candidatus Sericytochromatia bacterium]
MSIIKTLVSFVVVTAVLLLITIFSPKYNEISKDSLSSILKNIKYTEGMDLKDINNTIDFIPTDAVLSYKDKIVTSNMGQEDSQEKRFVEGEKNISNLTKSVQEGDLIINYRDVNEGLKYVPYIVAVLGGLFTGLGIFFMERSIKKDEDMTSYLKGEIQRLEMLNQGYELREKEFNKKIEKSIPTTLDEAQKLLKTVLKEKEVMINQIETLENSEDKLNKNIDRLKSHLSEAESKAKELQAEVDKVERQDKLVKELKARHEKNKNEIKEAKSRIEELEKVNPEKLQAEIGTLKEKVSELTEKYNQSKEQVKELSKIDTEKLISENQSFKDKITELKGTIAQHEETLKSGNISDLVKEKQEKEEYKKEAKELKAQLDDALNSLQSTDAGKIKKENIELENTNKQLNNELNQVKRDLQRHLDGDSMKVDNLRNELIEKNKEFEVVRSELEEALVKIKSLENSKDSSPKSETVKVVADSELSDKIKHLEHELEKSNTMSERFKRERDEKIKNFEELNEAFKNTNLIINQKEQEINNMRNQIQALELKNV